MQISNVLELMLKLHLTLAIEQTSIKQGQIFLHRSFSAFVEKPFISEQY